MASFTLLVRICSKYEEFLAIQEERGDRGVARASEDADVLEGLG